jgi:hypothetical protein
VFSGLNSPVKKLGLNFCLNKQTSLYFISDPVFKTEEANERKEYVVCLNEGEYLGM